MLKIVIQTYKNYKSQDSYMRTEYECLCCAHRVLKYYIRMAKPMSCACMLCAHDTYVMHMPYVCLCRVHMLHMSSACDMYLYVVHTQYLCLGNKNIVNFVNANLGAP